MREVAEVAIAAWVMAIMGSEQNSESKELIPDFPGSATAEISLWVNPPVSLRQNRHDRS